MLGAKLLSATLSRAIKYVGGKSVLTFEGSPTRTVSLTSLTGGVDTQPRAGDLVLLIAVYGEDNESISIGSATGYTKFVDLYSNDTYDTNFEVFYRYLASDQTSITFTIGGAVGLDDYIRFIPYVFRNVDPVNHFDVTSTTATGINGGRPTSPQITTVTNGAFVICCGGIATAAAPTGSALTAPSGTSGFVNSFSTAIGYTGCCAAHVGPVSAGTYGTFAFGGGTTQTSDSWAAATIALRPA